MFGGATDNVCVVAAFTCSVDLHLMSTVNCIGLTRCVVASFMRDSLIAPCPSLNLPRDHIIADFGRLWLG